MHSKIFFVGKFPRSGRFFIYYYAQLVSYVGIVPKIQILIDIFGLFWTNLTTTKDIMTWFFNTSQFTLVKIDFTLVNSQFWVFTYKCNF